MPTVRKRSASTSTKTASRRRDRVRDEEDDVEEEEDEEEERRPRKAASRTRKASTRSRREPEGDDEEEEDDEEETGDDDEEESEEEAPRRTRARSTKKATRSRRSSDDDEDADDEDDDRSSSRRRGSARKGKGGLPQGVNTGWEGADRTLKAGGGGADFLNLGKDVELVKFLEKAPFVSCRQHWVASEGAGQGNRPHLCPGKDDCPLCDLGDPASPMYAFNVLHLNDGEFPKVRVLKLGTRAYQNLKEVSADKNTGKPMIERGFYAVQRTGTGNKAQTSFRPVKERDIEEDWDEILENFNLDDLDDIIGEAVEDGLYDPSIIQETPKRRLQELARYLSDE